MLRPAKWGWVGLGRAGEGVHIKYSSTSKLYSTHTDIYIYIQYLVFWAFPRRGGSVRTFILFRRVISTEQRAIFRGPTSNSASDLEKVANSVLVLSPANLKQLLRACLPVASRGHDAGS